MAEGRKSTTERTYLDLSNEKAEKKKQEKTSQEDPNLYKESEKSVSCPPSDGVKSKQPSNTKTSPTSGVNTDIGMKCLDKNDRKLEKTKQENSSEKEPNGHEESEKPMPCRSSNGSYAERLPASESSPTSGLTLNIDMTYLHNPDEKVEKYLELVDDAMIKNEELSEKGLHEVGDEEPIPCTSLDKFNTKMPLAKESTSASTATTNISIEMTYLHKKNEGKVDKNRYMPLDQVSKRSEDIGRYEAPCTSTTGVNERPASQERHSTLDASSAADNEYDDVLIESENSSVPGASGYEEPDMVNSELPPVPGRIHSRRVTSTPQDTSVYQELE